MMILLGNLGEFQNLNFQLVAVQASGFFIVNPGLAITDIIIFIVGKIQNADMHAFLKLIIVLAFVELTGKHLAQIKQTPVVPVVHVDDLHLDVQLSAVFQKNVNIQYSLLFLLRPFGKFIFQDGRIPDLIRGKLQQFGDEPSSCIRIPHQLFEAPVDVRLHNKIFFRSGRGGLICHVVLLHKQSPFCDGNASDIRKLFPFLVVYHTFRYQKRDTPKETDFPDIFSKHIFQTGSCQPCFFCQTVG